MTADLEPVRAYFGRARTLDAHVAAKVAQIQRLQALAEGCSSVYGEHIRGGGSADRRMDVVAKIVDARDELQADIERLLRARQEISAAIRAVPDETNQTCLELIYLANQTIDQAAATMHYTPRNIHYVLNRALRQAREHNPDIFFEAST